MRAVLAVLMMALGVASATGQDARAPDPDDLRLVLARVLYPVQLMAYCWGEVDEAPEFVDAGRAWNERNFELLTAIETFAGAADIDDDERRKADVQVLAIIEQTISGQYDGAAYCRTIARIINDGFFDIDQREDLEEPLKRIFGVQ